MSTQTWVDSRLNLAIPGANALESGVTSLKTSLNSHGLNSRSQVVITNECRQCAHR
jgi:hypothetical protein